jgi:DinB superfamily
MEVNLNHVINHLHRTPTILRAMLQELPSEWITNNEGGQTWSPFDVVGHLIHGERTDWIPRAKIILESGENRAFDPFDRYAQLEENKGKTIDELLDLFEIYRLDNIHSLKIMNLLPEDLKKKGKHPDLGRVTLGELLASWVAHDLDHIVQISRTMSKQYREAVGPWRVYLSVMR